MNAPAPQQAFLAAMRAPLALAGIALAIERALPRELGLLLTLWLLWIAAALLGLAQALPGTLRVALLALLIVGSAALVVRAAWRIGIPALPARRARLERGGGLSRGALSLVIDAPVSDPDAFGAALWGRALADARKLRPRVGALEWQPAPETRYGLWPLIGTALFLGLLIAKTDAPARLSAAFSPWPTTLEGVRIAVTLEPPAYVGTPPRRIDLKGGSAAALDGLAASRVSIRVEGLEGWHVTGPGVEAAASGGRVSFPLERAGEYRVQQGARRIAALDLSLAADLRPAIHFSGEPAVTPTGALRLGYRLRDDHGVSALSLRLRRGKETRDVDLEMRVPPGRGSVFADLTPHVFAGSPVELMLVATDGAGQEGVSPPIRITLPQRRFANQFAQAIVAVRADLLAGAKRSATARRLAALAADHPAFEGDLGVFAGLRAATWRLVHDRRKDARESIAGLLWDIATDLEDGGATQAMDAMRRAMEDLARGIGTENDQSLAAMADQLEAAMNDYLSRQIMAALAEGGAPPPPSAGGAGASVDLGFLDQMFSDLRDRLAAGDKAGAAEALANLRQLMETIRFGSAAPDSEAQARAAAAAEAAEALRAIEARQGALRDATIADMIESSFGSDSGLRENAPPQRALGADTQALVKQFGAAGMPAPQPLGAAGKAMGEAAGALGAGDAGGAIRAQTRALDLLRQAANAAEAAAQQMAQAAGAGAMQPGAAGSGLDPLGRPGTGFGQGAVKLPDQADVRRIQQIRKILEDRASDPSRSEEERGYYLRLLKRF
ncbi:DUF4175 family protein [Sphingosinicella soli]|uniref:TIGR02302 family protein n=1 Tax=Sphingosinicella soli TaxID=333708 RepID=A0A7W7F6M1_9SPHN|nr:DUF4175 family protein [Sphingosinicella soli]MBB4631732.1 hypothetical protein [Sphingosinicella soli]